MTTGVGEGGGDGVPPVGATGVGVGEGWPTEVTVVVGDGDSLGTASEYGRWPEIGVSPLPYTTYAAPRISAAVTSKVVGTWKTARWRIEASTLIAEVPPCVSTFTRN